MRYKTVDSMTAVRIQNEGYEAYRRDIAREEAPYKCPGDEWGKWVTGWDRAKGEWEWHKPIFDELEAELACTPLPTSSSPRIARASEFLLMHTGDHHHHFKHIHTRNYLLLSLGGLGILIPNTGEPFHRGTFDWPYT